MSVLHYKKTTSSRDKITEAELDAGINFIMSDLTRDAYNEIVGDKNAPDLGWRLANFIKNPICIFGHTSSFICGRWGNTRVENGALRGTLHLAPAGTSPRIDEVRTLVQVGILKAVSV